MVNRCIITCIFLAVVFNGTEIREIVVNGAGWVYKGLFVWQVC